MNLPFAPRMKMRFSLNELGIVKSLARPVLLSLLIAYIGGLWLQLVHHQEGSRELVEIAPVPHWLRDSTLALPLIFLAVWSAMRLSRWFIKQRDWEASQVRAALVELTAVALLTSAVFTVGSPIHGWLFGATHQHETTFVSHLLRDGLISLPANVLLAGIFILTWPITNRAKRTSHLRPHFLVGTVLLVTTLVTAAAVLSPLSATLGLPGLAPQAVSATNACTYTVVADVVALDQPFFYNRLGAIQANGMIYALRRDVVNNATGLTEAEGGVLTAGNVSLREDKRARPLTLRVNEGDCLEINFQNLLHENDFIFNLNPEAGDLTGAAFNFPTDPPNNQVNDQPLTRAASIHIDGLALVGDIGSDGSNVGQNGPAGNGLVEPGGSATYTYYAAHEATHLMYSMGATIGGEGNGSMRSFGLFGAVNVQKGGAEWYRSQLTRHEMDWATPAEAFTDWNGNGIWDQNIPESFTDCNNNGIQDNSILEPFNDVNGDGTFEPNIGDTFVDCNDNGSWDGSTLVDEFFVDLNDNNIWDTSITEPLIDTNGDGVFNAHRTTPGGQPILDYGAVYPPGAGFGKEGLPIINMLNGNEIVHSDLNAIITGPGRGRFPGGTYVDNEASGDRNAPYREFTVVFHDEAFGVQAFPSFYADPVLGHTLHSVRDSFPINYGSGGIGSEIIANRLSVGPMWDCAECKYEEFFLTSFTVGDPAMIVDIPANTVDANGNLITGPKATKALYPDDPSNVHHSYLNDRVKFRNLHAGPKEHHIFHLHAHQWLFNPDDPQSNYLDGQAIGPGSGYTYEIAYGGSGNRNKTAGDSIFHCHFYPHFAQGMWELWRVHDTFEQGTILDANGLPTAGSRALPDGEITAGTPIPGVVPIPTIAMAPMPDAAATVVAFDLNGDAANTDGDVNTGVDLDTDGDGIADILGVDAGLDSSQFDANGDGTADILQASNAAAAPLTNPGYPWFTPGLVGHRPPTPAMDLADVNGDGIIDDGGLPRHVITSGPDEFGGPGVSVEQYQTRLDFNKILHGASAIQLPEGGTPSELVAMEFHSQQFHDSYLPDGTSLQFETNGLMPVAGAPYADPCRTDPGDNGEVTAIPQNRTIKGANIEMPIVLNKVGWHFQQQRFEALWEDVVPTLTNARAPQPMIMRLNSTDCAEFWHTNLVPNVYQLDDYQVRTPTDIIGQHIHLVKFDVMSADGSANGWNYEDGTLSPDEVQERITAFNHGGGFTQLNGTVTTALAAQPHPFFSATGPQGQDWLGARTTIQRWYADPLLERSWDGGVGTVFTHDHYGPSTHQQVGLYSTLLVEPEGSVWRHNETGELLATRHDGGPSGWQAIIETRDPKYTHREFYFEFADFQHAYEQVGGGLTTTDNGAGVPIDSYADFDDAINPSFRLPPANPADIFFHPNACPSGVDANGNVILDNPRPCPEAISADDPGTYALNFRNEPIALRVFNGQLGPGAGQAPGTAGDLAFAYQSRTDRAIAELNSQPAGPYPPLTADVQPGDPWTPLLRVYMGDKVRIRVQVGAHEEEHNFTIPGLKWRKEPNSPNSGWRNSEFFGIDEYFNLDVPIVPDTTSGTPAVVDYIYTVGAELEGMWNGVWGILRSYGKERNDLYELPNNNVGRNGYTITNEAEFNGICPIDAPLTTFDVTAVRAVDILGPQGLVYNTRGTQLTLFTFDAQGNLVATPQGSGPLIDPTALIYVLNQDLTYDPATGAPNGLQPGAPVEPLILRANAGDCVQVNLTNTLPEDLSATEMPGFNSLPPIVHKDENAAGLNGLGGITTFNANDITPSSYVGLTPQLLAFDPRTDGGFSTGLTTGRLVAPGDTGVYTWYAGDVAVTNKGVQGNRTRFSLSASPVEFGAAGLMPADRIKGSENGMVGAIIIEPQESCWLEDPGTRAQATVWKGAGLHGACDGSQTGTGSFRDFVTVMQNDVNLRYGGGTCNPDSAVNPSTQIATMDCAVPNIAAEGPDGPPEDPQDSGQKAINYGADPLWFRLGIAPNTPFGAIHRNGALLDYIRDVFSNFLDIGSGQVGDPQTEVYRASPFGPSEGRFRVVMPGGHARGTTYTLHGQEWQTQPYIDDSKEIGNSSTSQYYGAQEGVNPTGHWDFVVRLGGYFTTIGDYLWRDQASFGSYQGLWGLLRFNQTEPLVADVMQTVVKYQSVTFPLGVDLDGVGVTSVNVIGASSGTGTILDPWVVANGTVVDNGDGTVTYTSTGWPPCGDPFTCQVSFEYTAKDAGGTSAPATVFIDVTNTAPVANNDTIIIKTPDTSGSVDVLLNDFDAEGDLAAARNPVVTLIGQPVDRFGNQEGTIADAVLGLDGRTVTYTPPATFEGVVLITYEVTDESGAVSNQAVIRAAVNVDDITITQARYQPQNGQWTISGTCTDPFLPDGTTPTMITIFFGPSVEGSPPVIGTALCESGDPVGTWSFSGQSADPDNTTPDPNNVNFVSAESALQGFYEEFPVTFAGQNNPPVAANDAYTIDEDVVLNDNVLANDVDADFDPLTAILVTNAANGTLVLNADGSFTYTPNADYNGTDSFSYQTDDGKDLSNVATVTITIDPVNDAPRAGDDSYAMGAGEVLNGDVLANDFDVEGDAFTLNTTPVSGPTAGNILTLNANGSFTYTPDSLFTGVDSFVYEICETATPELLCGQATVTISVGVNDAPVAVDDAYDAVQNTALIVAEPGVLGNDTDADGDLLNVSAVNNDPTGVGVEIALASGATLTLNADGSFTYTPLFNFTGQDSFTYVANDGTVDSNVATVTITTKDVVEVTSATYRTRQDRWNIQGTVSIPTNSVDVYLCVGGDCASPVLIGAASVDDISGDWSFTGTGAVGAVTGDFVIAVSSGGGVSDPFPVNVRR